MDSLDALLGVTLPVLDAGFVRLVDYMGDEAAVVQAARVSYGAGTKRRQDDVALLRYLLRHEHTTPFEMCELKLHVRVPMDTWRQWIRHRTASVNEYSTRYSEAIDRAQTTPADGWRLQHNVNRQSSGPPLGADVGARLSEEEERFQRDARGLYERRLAAGIAREQARKDLPLSTYTEAYWKIDLHNLLHFLELRMKENAQQEIRRYATVIGERLVAAWLPNIWQAFVDYRCTAVRLTQVQVAIARALIAGEHSRATALAKQAGLVLDDASGLPRPTREGRELQQTLQDFGIAPAWSTE